MPPRLTLGSRRVRGEGEDDRVGTQRETAARRPDHALSCRPPIAPNISNSAGRSRCSSSRRIADRLASHCSAARVRSSNTRRRSSGSVAPLYQAGLGRPVHQFHRAVVPDAETLREIVDRHAAVARKPLDRQQRLVLPRRQPGLARRRFAECQEPLQQMPEFRERLVVAPTQPPCHRRTRPCSAGLRSAGLRSALIVHLPPFRSAAIYRGTMFRHSRCWSPN